MVYLDGNPHYNSFSHPLPLEQPQSLVHNDHIYIPPRAADLKNQCLVLDVIQKIRIATTIGT